ncbi:Hint domain-containing protein [Pseudomonas putida]|uniref:Hint domain-containing protein n=1 Tax=Pseudomonas putida TaxID=303 RepID=UPI0009BCF7F9|nr:Hint domain-containing protein [Pseudomonas putida]
MASKAPTSVSLLAALFLSCSALSSAWAAEVTADEVNEENALATVETLGEELTKDLTPGVLYQLDWGNPKHYAFYKAQQLQAGNTKAHAPELFRRMEAAHEQRVKALAVSGTKANPVKPVDFPETSINADAPLEDLQFISELSRSSAAVNSSAITYQSEAISSLVNGSDANTITLVMYNDFTGDFVASQTATDLTSLPDFRVSMSATVASAIPVRAVAVFSVIPKDPDAELPPPVMIKAVSSTGLVDACMTEPRPCERGANGQCVAASASTEACSNKLADKDKPILMCWNRLSREECDYWASQNKPVNYVIPVSGYAVTEEKTGSTLTGATTIYLQSLAGGGCRVYSKTGENLDDWTSDGNGKMSFQYAAETFKRNPSCLTNNKDSIVNFWMTNNVILPGTPDDPSPRNVTFVFTSDTRSAGQPGREIIPQLRIMEGCVAGGTLITLASGKTKKIEEIVRGDQVKTPTGVRTVSERTTGTENEFMLEIRTTGQTLHVTPTHPIMRAIQVGSAVRNVEVQAREIHPGDKLAVEGSPVTVTGVDYVEAHATPVYNLQFKGGVEGSYYANGILSGNLATQNMLADLKNRAPLLSPAQQRAKVHPAFLTDYDNQQKQKAQRSSDKSGASQEVDNAAR